MPNTCLEAEIMNVLVCSLLHVDVLKPKRPKPAKTHVILSKAYTHIQTFDMLHPLFGPSPFSPIVPFLLGRLVT